MHCRRCAAKVQKPSFRFEQILGCIISGFCSLGCESVRFLVAEAFIVLHFLKCLNLDQEVNGNTDDSGDYVDILRGNLNINRCQPEMRGGCQSTRHTVNSS